jgi:hypothetical protein
VVLVQGHGSVIWRIVWVSSMILIIYTARIEREIAHVSLELNQIKKSPY